MLNGHLDRVEREKAGEASSVAALKCRLVELDAEGVRMRARINDAETLRACAEQRADAEARERDAATQRCGELRREADESEASRSALALALAQAKHELDEVTTCALKLRRNTGIN